MHLDWQTLEEWLDQGQSPTYLLFANGQLLAAIAATPPLADSAWLRLLAIAEGEDPLLLFAHLWAALETALGEQGVHQVGALLLNYWLNPLLEQHLFALAEHVVTLNCALDDARHYVAPPSAVVVKSVGRREAEQAWAIDKAAFAPLWQMGLPGVRQAVRDSALYTVAYLDGQPVGYQISNVYLRVAHLARLAVLPQAQGKGVGAALVQHLLAEMNRRDVRTVTVNTQASNSVSQRLYIRWGFALTPNKIPCWLANLG
jgi:GNAT superfamily N-acetyltransferase